MQIKDILALPNRELKKHLETLAKEYFRLTGIIACTSCRGEIQEMISYLKNSQMETNFRLKKSTYYRIQKGQAGTIHNGNITDELALEFLAIKPSRASLFSKVSDTWQHDISEFMEDVQDTPKVAQEPQDEPCEECEKRKELQAFKMNELRELYPDIPAPVGTKKVDLIDAILASESK